MVLEGAHDGSQPLADASRSRVDMTPFVAACRALPRRTYLRSIKVALVVGTLLNLINQPEALFGSGDLVFWKGDLTFLVPFCVATYRAA